MIFGRQTEKMSRQPVLVWAAQCRYCGPPGGLNKVTVEMVVPRDGEAERDQQHQSFGCHKQPKQP